MKNIEFVSEDIYTFYGFTIYKDSYGFDLELTEEATKIDSKYFNLFRMIVQDNSELLSTGILQLSLEDIVENVLLHEEPKKDFTQLIFDYGFPPENTSRQPFVSLQGSFSSSNSFWKIEYPKTISRFGNIDSLLLLRDGIILYTPKTKEVYGSINIYEYLLHKTIEIINKDWKHFNQTKKYQALEKIQQAVKKADATMVRNYATTKIVSPTKIVPDIIQTSNGFKMTSGIDIPEINQEDFNSHVENRISADTIYNVKSTNDLTIKVLLSEDQTKVLSDIKHMEKASPKDLREFLLNPPENWNDDLVDVSNLYGDRVIGWKLYEPELNINNTSNNRWFEDSDKFLDEKTISLNQSEHEKKLLKTLNIKDNEEIVDYSESNINLLDKYLFPNIIKEYKEGIIPKKYQREGIAWLYSLYCDKFSGCILADDMGLGKTFQLLSFIQSIADKNLNILLIVPASLKQNWKNEYSKFFKQQKYKIILASNNRQPLKNLLQNQIGHIKNIYPTLYIASYENIRNCDLYIKIQWDVVILDEAQRIKNPKTLTNRTVRALKAQFKIAATGTPVENSFSDIWAISDFVSPGLLGSHKQFMQEFRLDGDEDDSVISDKGKKIRCKLDKIFLRRLKINNLPDLPKKELITVTEYMPSKQRNVYQQVLALATEHRSLSDKLQILQKLRQVSDHYSFINKFDTGTYSMQDTAKTIILKKILKNIKDKNEKVIIFAEFIHTQNILADIINQEFCISPQIFNGSTSIVARTSILARFKNTKGFNVIIMSPIAAGVGLTITEANNVIHFSRHWNPAKEDQATDRVYRIGQQKTVHVYTFIGKIAGLTTFDEKLNILLSKKQSIKGAALFPSAQLDINKSDLIGSLF
ncbi:MAG: hypothetical protein BKP49_02475 [Treponema sp. CETP13]|nr:MAG: hypothetical protein BKP49_02475 [Treponema sp. CETP13]